MIVSINQPAYLPWLGYFERIASSNLHITLDHVQFEKNSMTNRNKVRTAQGWTWLTVPISSKGKFGSLPIKDLQIPSELNWQNKHWNTLRGSYSKTPFFKKHSNYFEEVYLQDWHEFNPLVESTTQYLLDTLSIKTEIIKSSDLKPQKNKSELILELCLEVGATTYLSGLMGKDYLDVGLFERHGIKVQFQHYQHPEYKQIHEDYLPYMSVIDLLFNEGGSSREIIMKGSNVL